MAETNASLREALGLKGNRRPIVSVVGAGGKTTTIKRLAEEYREQNIPVIVTTTTHMKVEHAPWFLLEPSVCRAREVLQKQGMVWIGLPCGVGKMKAPPANVFEELMHLGYPVLIEADGAKGLPVKAPAAHEPVICSQTTHVINVYGLHALGKAWEKAGFRVDRILELLELKKTEPVQVQDIANLALHAKAGKKGVTAGMQYYVLLNQADGEAEKRAAAQICARLKARKFTKVAVTGRQTEYENTN